MSQVIHRSFAGGEITPAMYARVDTSKYQTGLRTCLNMIIARHGGAYNRPGTKYVAEVKDSSKRTRILPFIFNDDQTYILELGDQYIRFVRDGSRVLESAQTITAATQANPVKVSVAGHGYSSGDTVYIDEPASGILTGMLKNLVNGTYTVSNVGVNDFDLLGVDGSTWDAFDPAGAQASRVYEISSPYLEADLFDLHFSQSADVITIVHPDYAPRELSRTGHTSWSLGEIAFRPTEPHPTAASGSGSVGSETHKYKVTAIDPETQEESLPGVEAAAGGGITDISTSLPGFNAVVTTSIAHGYSDGDTVLIDGVAGMTEVNNRRFEIANVAANTFELVEEDSSSYTAYSSGGEVYREDIYLVGVKAPTAGAHTITWTGFPEVKEYSIYLEENGVYGFIGISGAETYTNEGVEPDTADTPPRERNPFRLSGDYPSTVGYYQQRRVFAGADNNPETFFCSKTGFHSNFTTSFPLQDDDAIRATLSGGKVNRIRSILDLNTLVILTSGSEWTAQGDPSGTLTPTAINARQQTYYGCSILQPLIVGGNALYVQDRGSAVRDMFADFDVSGYRGNDLSVFASHLFDGFTIDDLTYQKIPNSIAWFVRSDGVMLGLTYIREHQIFAWHRHEIGSAVESAEAIPSGTEDSLYVATRRAINSSTVRYIEEMQTRLLGGQDDMIFMDSAFTYDGRNTDTALTVTLTGGSSWNETESITLTTSSPIPGGGAGDHEFHVFDSDGGIVRFTVESAPAENSTGTVFTVRSDRSIPVSLQGVATWIWTRAKKTLYGLHHLISEDLSILGDGNVVGSPNDPSQATYTVTSTGSLTLDRAYGTVHAGIPYVSDVETLDVDIVGGGSIADRKRNPTAVGLLVEATRGVYAGQNAPTSTEDAIGGLYEYKIRYDEAYDDPTELKTGYIEVNINSKWSYGGRIFLRQIDPLPVGILGILPIGSYPFGGR